MSDVQDVFHSSRSKVWSEGETGKLTVLHIRFQNCENAVRKRK